MIVSALLSAAVALALAGCGGGAGTTSSGDKGQQAGTKTADVQVIYDYFSAINDGRYEDAYKLRTMSRQPQSNYQAFVDSLKPYVKSVKVKSVTTVPGFDTPQRKQFDVKLDAKYLQKYPAGSGELAEFYVVVPDPRNKSAWLIDSEGTGP